MEIARKQLLVVALITAPFVPACATEGGLGRPITGIQGTSYSGLIPPTPGWNMQIGYVHYSGEIGAQREIPIGGLASLGLDATFDMMSATGLYIWDTGEEQLRQPDAESAAGDPLRRRQGQVHPVPDPAVRLQRVPAGQERPGDLFVQG